MPRVHRPRLALSIALLPLVFLVLGAARERRARYDSEEHRLIVDRGVAGVKIPATITLPTGIALSKQDASTYIGNIRRAKRLAVGFDGNNPNAYNEDKEAVQDNCYYHGYGQLKYNKAIWVPSDTSAPPQVLTVNGYASASPTSYTLGELAAIYGDYRRTTHCDAAGHCHLTNADIPQVRFIGGVIRTGTTRPGPYCPGAVPAGEYLQDIASGVVPPFGEAGNATANTANDDQYGDAGWWGDEMLRIAQVNDWHFSSGAVAWYVGLHRLALIYVDSARRDNKHWMRALHYEANALHALTDLFAFGHVITSRDETSFAIMQQVHLLDAPAYRWTENVIRMGGGVRSTGVITLSSTLPALADMRIGRVDFLPSYPKTTDTSLAIPPITANPVGVALALRALREKGHHDDFNASGARVRNLNGDSFKIFGDAGLSKTVASGKSADVLANAVRVSVQALFDAYGSLSTQSVAQKGSAGSDYFAALKYLPVYVDSAKDHLFTGMWTRYAKAVNDISGANKPLTNWAGCVIEPATGGVWSPRARSGPCAPPPMP